MYVVFAFWPFLIVAPVVVIAGLMVWAIPVAIIIVFGGICLMASKGSRLVAQSARKLRQAENANHQSTHAGAKATT
jgi:cytochrome c-type biogenesis protein CcmH/NrfF